MGADVGPARAMVETAAWCHDRQRAIRRVVDVLGADAAVGRLGGPVVWQDRSHPSHVRPYAATLAAHRAADAARGRDDLELAAFLAGWADDPVFASTLLRLLGPRQVLGVLLRWSAADGGGARPLPEVVAGIAETLGTAGDRAPFGITEIVALAGDDPFRLAAIGLLAAPVASPSTRLLVDLVDDYLVHVNRLVRRGDVRADDLRVVIDGDQVDPRVLVLDQLTRNPAAATRAFTAHPVGPATDRLDLLLPTWTAYGDDGLALGRAMVAATEPRGGHAGAVRGALVDVVRWVAEHRDLPPLAHDALGQVAAPHLGSFRPDHLADGHVDDPAPGIDEATAVAFLTFAARRQVADDALRVAALAWTHEQVLAAAAHPAGGDGHNEIGGVLGLVEKARARGSFLRSADRDAGRAADRSVVAAALAMLGSVPSPKVALPATAASLTLDAWLPPGAELAAEALRLPLDLAASQVAAELLLTGALWRARADNGLWTAVVGEAVPPPPPPEVLLQPVGEPGSSATGRIEAFLRWKEQSAVSRSRVGRMLDALGASYGDAGAGLG